MRNPAKKTFSSGVGAIVLFPACKEISNLKVPAIVIKANSIDLTSTIEMKI